MKQGDLEGLITTHRLGACRHNLIPRVSLIVDSRFDGHATPSQIKDNRMRVTESLSIPFDIRKVDFNAPDH